MKLDILVVLLKFFPPVCGARLRKADNWSIIQGIHTSRACTVYTHALLLTKTDTHDEY